MKIKYGELPPQSVCEKLVMVSFDSPQKNLAVFKFCSAMLTHLAYIENERSKLFQKHGVPDSDNPDIYRVPPYKLESFQLDFRKIAEMEVEEEIKELPLTEDDFLDENCQYPLDKAKWMNGSEIATVLKFCG